MKKLLTLGLSAQPGGILTILGFCYNLLKRHPSLFPMIHVKELTADHLNGMKDMFLLICEEPEETLAANSCAWEIQEFMRHWHPSVSGFARVFSEPFVNQEYDLEDFLDITYDGLIDDESRRKVGNGSALTGAFVKIESDDVFCF